MSEEDILPVGKIIGLHGVKGEVKVLPYGDLRELSGIEWDTIYLKIKGGLKACKVKRVRGHKGTLIFELEGYPARNDSEVLVGLEVYLKKDELPGLPEGEYYYYDLIGMEVLSEDGIEAGRIVNIIHTGSNDVLEVEGPLGDVLIPAIEEAIVKVDMENKKVIVRLLEGLLPEGKSQAKE